VRGSEDVTLERVARRRPRAEDHFGLDLLQCPTSVQLSYLCRKADGVAPAVIVGGDDVHATLRQEAAEGAVAGSDLETASITNQVGQRGDERGGVEAPDALRLN